MASAFAVMKNYGAAQHFQQMAVEQAQLSDKSKQTALWNEYDTKLAASIPKKPSGGSAAPPGSAVVSRDTGQALGIPGQKPAAGKPASEPAPDREQPFFVDRSGFSVP
jgi:hypothetical protein